ncbi:MAG: AgmX/PglI C-terminal domain-containing protein [Deltaproteobacteria bacterium]|nr:AgmX/PglI C-terminal domain-containing protein [Deltaproteobacteria bacterium]
MTIRGARCAVPREPHAVVERGLLWCDGRTMRFPLAAIVLLGCGAARPTPAALESAPARPEPAPISAPAPKSERPLFCVDGLLLATPHGLKVTGGPRDMSDPRAPDIGAGACLAFPALFRCRNEASKKGTPEGTLEISLSIDDHGAVISAKRAGGSIGVGELSQCVEKALAAQRFTADAKGETKYDITMHAVSDTLSLTENGTDIRGRLLPDIIKPTIRAKFPMLRACYEDVLKKNQQAFGTARFEFLINEQGAVTGEKITVDATMDDATLEGCLLGVVRSLAFPPPEVGKVLVVYPIVFQSGL